MDIHTIFRQQMQAILAEQLASGQPPEAAATLQRLCQQGQDEAHAKALLCACIAAEMNAMLAAPHPNGSMDMDSYKQRLARLPQL